MNELTERLNLDREEMKNRLSDLEARFNALEARLDDMAKSIEIRHDHDESISLPSHDIIDVPIPPATNDLADELPF